MPNVETTPILWSLTEDSKPDLVGSQVLEVPLLIPFVLP